MEEKESLKEIHEQLDGGAGKVAVDEAGRPIGTARAQVVRDPISGAIIGRVTDAPPVEEGPSAHELMQEGFHAPALEAEKEIKVLIEQMTGWAREARTAQDRVSQWDFQARVKTAGRIAELQASFDQANARISELRNGLKTRGIEKVIGPFLAAADAHLANMKRHFTEEGPGHVNRF